MDTWIIDVTDLTDHLRARLAALDMILKGLDGEAPDRMTANGIMYVLYELGDDFARDMKRVEDLPSERAA